MKLTKDVSVRVWMERRGGEDEDEGGDIVSGCGEWE